MLKGLGNFQGVMKENTLEPKKTGKRKKFMEAVKKFAHKGKKR